MHDLSRICIFAFYVGGVGIYTFLWIISGICGSDKEWGSSWMKEEWRRGRIKAKSPGAESKLESLSEEQVSRSCRQTCWTCFALSGGLGGPIDYYNHALESSLRDLQLSCWHWDQIRRGKIAVNSKAAPRLEALTKDFADRRPPRGLRRNAPFKIGT